MTTSATEGAGCSSGGILGFALVTSHALPSVAGGVAGVAWLGDLALAGAAAAGGHDGDGFGESLWDWAGGRVDGGGVFGVERWVSLWFFF